MTALRARVAVLLAAALAAFALLVPSAAFAAEVPEPPERSAFTSENTGAVSLEKDGSRVTVRVDAERVYVFVYPGAADPVGVGWQEPVEGSFGIDLSLMPPGEVAVAVLDENGELLGWAGAELAEDESHAPSPEADAPEDPPEQAAPAWPWAAGGGVLIVALLAVAMVVIARRRRAVPDADPDDLGDAAEGETRDGSVGEGGTGE